MTIAVATLQWLTTLDESKMTVNPGGKQRVMAPVLTERGIEVSRKKAEEMRATLAAMDDFKTEKSPVERYLIQRGHIPAFLLKFHPEVNPIERVWAQLKQYTKAHCKYIIQSNVPDS